jgi:hypothetical protein
VNTQIKRSALAILLVAAQAHAPAVQADFELAAPDGRRVLLKDDGTWRYAATEDKGAPGEQVKEQGEAVLTLLGKTELRASCRFEMQLVNNLPYEIRTIVPSFVAHRSSGVIYDRVSANFNALLPGNSQKRQIEFLGINCKDIARLQVAGANRCTMGELDRYSPQEGQCLGRIRVVESDVVRFDK